MRRVSCIGNFALGVLAAMAAPAATLTVTNVNGSPSAATGSSATARGAAPDSGSTSAASASNPNDPGEGDGGGNGLQNFPPILTAGAAAAQGAGTRITGVLNSTASTQFTNTFDLP